METHNQETTTFTVVPSENSVRKIAFALSLMMVFMMPWEGVIRFAGLGNNGPTAVKFLGIGITAFWIITVILTGKFRKPEIFHIVVFLFVLWIAFSVFWSGNASRTVNQLVTWVLLLVFILIVWDLYTTQARIFAGLQAYIFGAYVAVGIAVGNFFSGKAFYTHYQRFSPDETNPDGFGLILAFGIPIAWYLANSAYKYKFSSVITLINYAYIPIAFVGLALSGTRTAFIAAFPGMIFGIASLSRVQRSTRILIFIFITLAIIAILPYVGTLTSFQRLGTITDEITAGDLTGRLTIWDEGLDSFGDHPLIGVGANMYRSVNSIGKVAHNSFLSVLVELGLIGFLLFGLILIIVFIRAWSLPKWDKRFWLTLLVVWLIGASTLTWEYRKTTWLFMSLVVANAALPIFSPREEKQSEPNLIKGPINQFNATPKFPMSR